MTTFSPAAALGALDPNTRVNYTLGMILGAEDLRQDQRYQMARDDRHQRALHGWGVACGLEVDIGDGSELRVHPGMAVDAVGQTICISSTQCADLLAWLADQDVGEGETTVWVLACYDACETDLLPVPSGPCRDLDDALAASRLVDSFELRLSLEPPPLRNDPAHPSFEAVLEQLEDEAADLEGLRATLHGFVTERGTPPAFANRCLDPEGDPCVPLAVVTVDLEVGPDGGLRYAAAPTEENVNASDRPILLSSTFLQEWLLRVAARRVDLGLMELRDTAAGTPPRSTPPPQDVPDAAVVRYDAEAALWVAQRLELGLLADVGVREEDLGEDVYLGWDQSARRWTASTVPVPEPSPDDFVHARRDTRIGIVAAGVVEMHFAERDSDPGVDLLASVELRTRYGGLSLVEDGQQHPGAWGTPLTGAVRVTFHGLAEALQHFPPVEGRQFVVKVTPEARWGSLTASVVRLDDRGIVIRWAGNVRDDVDERWTEAILEVFGVEPDEGRWTVALHIEVSVFDDPEVGTEHEAVEALWEAVR
jgi:hypothetical protein